MIHEEGLKERLASFTKFDLPGILRDFFLHPMLHNMDKRYGSFHTVRVYPPNKHAYPSWVTVEVGPVSNTGIAIVIDLDHMTVYTGDGYEEYGKVLVRWFNDKCGCEAVLSLLDR